MKKWLIGLVLLIVIISAAVFIFIPAQLTVSKISLMKANSNATMRILNNETEWNKWWPGKKAEKNTFLKKQYPSFDGYTYQITNRLYNAVEVNMKSEKDVYKAKVVIIPFSDSIAVQWQTGLFTGNNPVTRILQYRRAVKIRNNLTVILDSLKAFNENTARLYRFNIRLTTLKDTALITTKTTTDFFPSTTDIYRMINTLKKYIADNRAKETNFPMLNITKLDSIHYITMTAIATDRSLPEKGNISPKRFLAYKNKIIAAEVKGGQATIKQAYNEIATYMNDYQLSSAVIPFEYLITDRLKEPDSSKWITKIYMPIR